MPASPLPTIHTPRLTLRPVTAADVPAVDAMIAASRESFARWFGWARGSTRESVREHTQQSVDAMALETARHYVVLTSAEGLIARIGLYDIDPVNLSAELGYMLRTEYEGQGVMTEALRGMLSHTFGPDGLHRVTAYVDTENIASQRVLERLGFQREGTVRHAMCHPERGWRDHHLYGLLSGELRL